MEFVDTHCHIQSAGETAGERSTLERWIKHPDRTIDTVIEAAVAKDVTRMVMVGCDLPDSQLAIEQAQNRSQTWASIGLHPHETAKSLAEGHLEPFAALVTSQKVVAVGETGLDYFYEHSPREAQIEVLKFQFELASKHNLPMIFHVREAFEDFWPIFDSYHTAAAPVMGVLHSFTDTQANLDMAIERGLFIGVNGIATFAKNEAQVNMYKSIPLSRLLLETDAPFLTPHPYRGTICEPYHISVIADFLGGLRNEPVTDIARTTTENAVKLFNLY